MHDHSHPAGHGHDHGAKPAQGGASPVDPVCGMTVSPDSPRRFAFEGVTYFFCCDGCVKKFSAEPAKYVAKLGPRCTGRR